MSYYISDTMSICSDPFMSFCNEGWAKRNAKDLLVTDIDAAFRKLESDDAEEQSKFDNETSHGTSLEKEQEWERRYEVK